MEEVSTTASPGMHLLSREEKEQRNRLASLRRETDQGALSKTHLPLWGEDHTAKVKSRVKGEGKG